MSTTPTEPQDAPVPTAVPTPPPAAQPTPPVDPAPAKETDWVAEARKWEDRAKANKEAADELAKIKEAQKTEAEKAADRLAAAEKRASEAELKALRADVAQTKGVPASLLSGSTQQELEAAADALIAFRSEAPKLPVAPSSYGQGKVGEPVGGAGGQLTEAQLASMTAEQINAARRNGQLNDLLRR